MVIDEVTAPSQLRERLERRFELYETVQKDLPDENHGTVL